MSLYLSAQEKSIRYLPRSGGRPKNRSRLGGVSVNYGNWLIEAAWNDDRIDGPELTVVLVIAAHADWITGECFLALSTIARYTRKTPRSVSDLIEKLQLNQILRYQRGNGSGHVSWFKLLLEKGEVSAKKGAKFSPLPAQKKGAVSAKKGAVLACGKDNHPNQHSVSSQRGTRIPDPFILTAEMRSYATSKRPNVDVAEETEKFVNYWRSKPGASARKLNWAATWRNWILNSRTRLKTQEASNAKTGLSASERNTDRLAKTFNLGEQIAADEHSNARLYAGIATLRPEEPPTRQLTAGDGAGGSDSSGDMGRDPIRDRPA